MENKTLILLTDSYPLSAGEFFLDDEMRILSNWFEKIIVVTKEQGKSDLKRFVPENMVVHTYTSKETFKDKFKAVACLFYSFFRKELVLAVKKYKIKPSVMLFKVMYMDLVRALKIKTIIESIIEKHNIDEKQAIFYSYWHDYKALSLSLLKNQYPCYVCIARAHHWDIYFYLNTFPYLPFKSYIIKSLNQTYSVSLAGKNELERVLGVTLHLNITVSKLGKLNSKAPVLLKNSNNYIFCSCSSLIGFKRVHLLIDILSKLKLENIKWIHFGDGYLRTELKEYAKKIIPDVDYCFKGVVNNKEIMDFYHENYVDMFINVSESEGVPVSIMEALSAGIPVLATNVGGTSEAVNDEIGFLVEKNFDVEEVVNKIENYLQSTGEKQKEYRKKAYLFWKENYNAENNYRKFADSLLNL